jgi:ribonuclease HI
LINDGRGTNTKAELLGAWTTLTLAKHLNLTNLHLMGDSKLVIEWLKQKVRLNSVSIEGWKNRIHELVASFQTINYSHIFREFNMVADTLSKEALLEPSGRLIYYRWINGMKDHTYMLDLF